MRPDALTCTQCAPTGVIADTRVPLLEALAEPRRALRFVRGDGSSTEDTVAHKTVGSRPPFYARRRIAA
jgi:hypothetical protein